MFFKGLKHTIHIHILRFQILEEVIFLPERVMKYGGVKFRNLVPPVKINRFVNKLPQYKKDSLFEVANELSQAGLIEILNDRQHSTIDQDVIDNMTTNTGNYSSDTNFKRHEKSP